MSDKIKGEIFSISQTFLASFILIIASLIVEGRDVQWTIAFWISITMGAIRSALKIVIQKYAPTYLGGNA